MNIIQTDVYSFFYIVSEVKIKVTFLMSNCNIKLQLQAGRISRPLN